MENKMTIDEKIAYIRQALEMGADISLSFHDCRDKEEAEKVAATLSEAIKLPVKYNESKDSNLRWLKIRYNYSEMETVIFYDEKETYLEEDVQFGGVEDVTA